MKAELLVLKISLWQHSAKQFECVVCVFRYVLFSGFEQLIECEDRNKLRENETFVPRN